LEQAKRQLDAALRGLSDTDSAPAESVVSPAVAPAASAPQATARSSAPTDPLLTLTRLLVGAGLLGMDELARRAPEWERQAALDSIPPTEAAAAHSAATVTDRRMPATDEQAGMALVGWIFATQAQLRAAPDLAHWLQSATSQLIGTVAVLASQALGIPSSRPRARTTYRDDSSMAHWIALGRAEERHCRALARVAMREIVQDAIDYMAKEPAIRELIQTQSTSMATDALGEVRERSVSADLVVDSLVRRVFRRRSVPSLDPPAIDQP